MVVDGRDEFVGSDDARARQSIAEAAKARKASIEIDVQSEADESHVDVLLKVTGLPKDSSARLWVAVAEDDVHSDVRRGENSGRKLNHVAVVRSLAPADAGKPLTIELDKQWRREKLRLVAFAQDTQSMHILGVATAAVPAVAPER
jgi:hypothetical protein